MRTREAIAAHAHFAAAAAPTGHRIQFNPAVSPRQQRLMGAELGRARRGERTRTGMSTGQLEEFARKPKGGY